MKIGFLGPINGRELLDLLDTPPELEEGPRAPILSLLIRELISAGHQVDAFTLSPHPGDFGRYVGQGFTLNIGPQRSRARDRALDLFKLERKALISMIRDSPPDVLHAHWTYEYTLAAMGTRLPTVVTVHDWAPAVLAHHRHVYRVFRLIMQYKVLRKASNLTANSPYIAAKIRRWYRRDVPVIPNGIPFGREPIVARIETPVVLGTLNVAFDRRKNITTLLHAFQIVRSEAPEMKLRLAGDAFSEGGEAQQWATSHGVAAGVEFVGPLHHQQVPNFLGSLHVFVHPALEESFGMVLIEAMREGTPVLGGVGSGAVPWVLDNGRAGALTDVRSATGLARAILDLVLNETRRADLARAGYESAAERFSISAVTTSYVGIYESAIRSVAL